MRHYSVRERVVLGIVALVLVTASMLFFPFRTESAPGTRGLGLAVSVVTVAILLRIVISGGAGRSDRSGPAERSGPHP